MSLWKIALRSIQQRGLASVLTIASMALGVALIVAVLVVHGVIDQSFRNTANGYEMIVGGKGGKLELVLSTVYHIGRPIEPLPWTFYKEFIDGGKYASRVKYAIPCCLGDNYEGHRIVATTPEMFTSFEFAAGKKYEFAGGRNFGQAAALAAGEKLPPKKAIQVLADDDDADMGDHHDHSAPPFFNEAVVGALAARRTGLKVGDSFEPTHGVTTSAEEGHKHDPVKVVGILKPTGTPNDQVIFMNIEGFFLLAGHSKSGEHHHGPLPDEEREVTAVLVRSNFEQFPTAPIEIARSVNEGSVAQVALPRLEISMLLEKIVGPISTLLLVVAGMIVVVAGIGIIVSIYNSMNERRKEIAVMRSLGAGRSSIMSIVMIESLLLALAGGLLGFIVGHLLLGVSGSYVLEQTGVSIGFLEFPTVEIPLQRLGANGSLVVPIELILLPGLVLLAGVVGYFPAVTAYRTDVSRALSNAA